MRDAGFDKIYFAWAGGVNKGDPHYYRIQSPAFLIEYDNTQNNANHIHSVWRDFNGDFGEDLLREHYQTTPHGATQQKVSQQEAPQQEAPQQYVRLVANPDGKPVARQPVRLDAEPRGETILPLTYALRPKILYREKAGYTRAASDAEINGVIKLAVIFGKDGVILVTKINQGLPFGLNEQAITAARKIKFEPAYKNGEPVSVRGSLEFSFNIEPHGSGPDYWPAGVGHVGNPELIQVKKPEYTEAARNNRVEGDVRLMVIFGSNGKISNIDVLEELPDGLTEKAIEVAKAIKFKPATYSNSKKTVNVWGEIAITFKLDQ
jgi:TonB family protein